MRTIKMPWTRFYEINMGATAIGTGLNSPPGYAELVQQVRQAERDAGAQGGKPG